MIVHITEVEIGGVHIPGVWASTFHRYSSGLLSLSETSESSPVDDVLETVIIIILASALYNYFV